MRLQYRHYLGVQRQVTNIGKYVGKLSHAKIGKPASKQHCANYTLIFGFDCFLGILQRFMEFENLLLTFQWLLGPAQTPLPGKGLNQVL